MEKLLSRIDRNRIPSHVAVIMDGNGRWARKKNMERIEGHRAGSLSIERLMDDALDLKIKCVSFYAFSTENWSRPAAEVNGLWNLMIEFFDKKLPIMIEKGAKVHHSGTMKKLPKNVRTRIEHAVESTKKNNKIILNFCLNYGSQQEITDSVNKWIETRKENEKITIAKIERNLYTNGLPPVDLMIRTSGEYRLSNFLLWQIAYAELIFVDVLWPDFGKKDLYNAVIEYQKRDRRYGGI
ncbi:MAG: di-trans,poly-cis-decaprenylcistransferase [Spirochaetes bacterium]|nr:di-trans,poly-cis-decaprenylcistransferase [Spirochaetota bacterium]